MATSIQNLISAATRFLGGSAIVTGNEETASVVFSGTWAAGDNWTVILTDSTSGVQTQIGSGTVSSLINSTDAPVFAMTFADKEYVIAGTTVYFSAIGDSLTYNDPNASGNDFLNLATSMAMPTNLSGMAQYQGRVSFFSKETVQIWSTPADPAQWALQQTMQNIGNIHPGAIQALGDLDVLFLWNTGIRSLRVREAVLNAYVNDIGAPIDTLLQDNLITNGIGTICSIIDPQTGRAWEFVNNLFYVLSYYPSNKITAWSTYEPTSDEGYYFTPVKMAIFNGQVILFDDEQNFYIYGGTNNNTYDATIATVQTPFHDLGSPTVLKTTQSLSVDVTCPKKADGTWNCAWDFQAAESFVFDPDPVVWSPVVIEGASAPTFDSMLSSVVLKGTHFSILGKTSGVGPASLGMIALAAKGLADT